MGKTAGRPPKPPELKLMQGTDRTDRVNEDEPVAEERLGDPPKRLSKLAKEMWLEFAPVYWWLGDADRPTFERFCETFALLRKTTTEVNKSGPVQTVKSGYETTSGAMQAWSKLDTALDRIASDLGQTPVSRTKIRTGKKPVENPWSEFKKF